MKIHFTLLHLAICIMDRSLSLVKILLKYGVDVNAITTDEKATPLMIAAAATDLKVTNHLLSNGARVNDVSSDGMTALHCVFLNRNSITTHYSLTEFALEDVKLKIFWEFVNRQADLDLVIKKKWP